MRALSTRSPLPRIAGAMALLALPLLLGAADGRQRIPAAVASTTIGGSTVLADGWRAFEAGDCAAATRLFTAGLDQGVGAPRDRLAAHNNRGICRRLAGDDAGALADYEAALGQRVRRPEPLINRGNLRYAQDRTAEAEADFRAALAIENHPDAHIGLGLLALRQDDLPAAEAAFTTALAIDPERPLALRQRALVRMASADLDGARTDLDALLTLLPDDPEALSDRAAVRRAQGDAAGALADAERLLALSPDRIDGSLRRAEARLARGDRQGALSDAERAVALDARSADARVVRAQARAALGDGEGARADLREALRLDPEHPLAGPRLATLERAARPE